MATQKIDRNMLNTGIVDNSNATAITIDSGENVLVAKSSLGATDTVGHELKANGSTVHTVDGNPVMYLNRKTSDGTLAEFRKDNTTIGSIGVKSDDTYIVTGDTGIRFNDGNDQIWPVSSSGTSRDAAIDIGNSSVRFKDLHLSGTANVGGGIVNLGTADYSSGHLNAFESMSFNIDADNDDATRYFSFHTNGSDASGTELMRITEAGNVGIGTATPKALSGQKSLTINASVPRIDFKVGDVFKHHILAEAEYMSISADADNNQSNSRVIIEADNAVVARFDSDGIKFGADTASANALDKYEEGTWTPTFSSATLQTANGTYTRIGNQVTVHYHLVTQGGLPSSGTPVQVGGLPFSSASNMVGAGAIYARYYSPNDSTLTTIIFDSENVIRLVNINEQSFDYTLMGELEGGTANNEIYVIGTMTYQV